MMKRHISDQQDLADNAGEDLTVTWYKKYIKLFGQIDDHVKYIVPFPKPGRQFRFLDLGYVLCAILNAHPTQINSK